MVLQSLFQVIFVVTLQQREQIFKKKSKKDTYNLIFQADVSYGSEGPLSVCVYHVLPVTSEGIKARSSYFILKSKLLTFSG